MTTPGVVDFVLAQIAEYEARCADPHDWYHDDPRLAAQLESQRQAIKAVRGWVADGFPNDALSQAIFAALAVAYADHDDFNPEWRADG